MCEAKTFRKGLEIIKRDFERHRLRNKGSRGVVIEGGGGGGGTNRLSTEKRRESEGEGEHEVMLECRVSGRGEQKSSEWGLNLSF